jgi:hypothetical protein
MKKFRSQHRFILFGLFFIAIHLITCGQQENLPPKNFRNNLIKINLLTIAPLINGNNQKWLGFEYERFLKPNMSITGMADFGLFEDYTFTKYYDFFGEDEGFHYTSTHVRTWGYHLIPSFRYYFLATRIKKGQGFYVAGSFDFHQYFRRQEDYLSLTGESLNINSTTSRLSIGASLGGQYVAFSRLAIDLNINIFATMITIYNGDGTAETEPLHATWIFGENQGYGTVNLMIGYAFGGGKRK